MTYAERVVTTLICSICFHARKEHILNDCVPTGTKPWPCCLSCLLGWWDESGRLDGGDYEASRHEFETRMPAWAA